MSSVWIVEQGEYSDYGVVGVFSTEENARVVCEKINAEKEYYRSEASVAEWPLDPGIADLRAGREQWIVNMARDGTVSMCEKWEGWTLSCHELGRDITVWPDRFSAIVWATDAEHAVKVANEWRTGMLASGEWERLQRP